MDGWLHRPSSDLMTHAFNPQAVRDQWSKVDRETANDLVLGQLIDEASANPRLSRLFPFLSVGRLCFSRCIEFPYYVDVLITPNRSTHNFQIETTCGRGGWASTKVIGLAENPRGAVQVAANVLPSDYDSARSGNADQWRPEFDRLAQTFRALEPTDD
jgi:hypothetical protein